MISTLGDTFLKTQFIIFTIYENRKEKYEIYKEKYVKKTSSKIKICKMSLLRPTDPYLDSVHQASVNCNAGLCV